MFDDAFLDYAGPILLVGILVPGLLMALAGRVLVGKERRAEYVARIRKSERPICLSAGVCALSQSLTFCGVIEVEIIGVVITVSGLGVLGWILLRSIPPRPPRRENDLGRDI